MPLNVLSLSSLINGIKVIIDFVIVWVVVYYTLRIVRNNSRTVQIFKGIVLVITTRIIATYLSLTTVKVLLDFVIQYGFLVVMIIFQPEIRGLLERLGKSSAFSALYSLSSNEKEKLVGELVEAAITMSKERTGALITLEQGHSLSDYIKTGTPINSSVSAEVLCSLFAKAAPLHDGAVIIQGDRIACASAYFPPTALELPSRYGARHRAAIGISEITDSVTIVVSEETGTITIAEKGKLTEVDADSLREFLDLLIRNSEKELSERIELKKVRKVSFQRLNVDPIRVESFDEEKEEEPRIPREKRNFPKITNPFKKVKPQADHPESEAQEEQAKALREKAKLPKFTSPFKKKPQSEKPETNINENPEPEQEDGGDDYE